jgi:RNA polymerase sigma-70 factor (ECF subfamily)
MTARRAGRERNELIALFMERRSRLIQQATRIIGCQCLAEDVVQETMLKICEGGIEEEIKSPAAYLFRMVRNLAIDCARRRSREMGLATAEDASGELVAQCPCPEETMARCQALRLVAAALQELPERTRRAFERHRIEGVSQRDIAAELQVSPTLVNFMVRDAHNHCRARLVNGEVDGDLLPAPAGRQPVQAGDASADEQRSRRPRELAGERKAREGRGKRRGGKPAGENAVEAPVRRRGKQAERKDIALLGQPGGL